MVSDVSNFSGPYQPGRILPAAALQAQWDSAPTGLFQRQSRLFAFLEVISSRNHRSTSSRPAGDSSG